ncbi:hypothetical protein NIES22_52430 [Calothrix brevissima NIES-22]|nr:hypothetical protein NIES22_52430 [Calothrix brevissima NIES-22]
MSLFYNSFFIKTQESVTKLQEKFSRVETFSESEWIVCNFHQDYINGLFEPGFYFTPDISLEFAETIFISVETSNDQFEYEHSQAGNIIRKLSWLSDGCQSTWAWLEGENEEWEKQIIFSENNFAKTLEMVKYDDNLELLPEEQLLGKQQELRVIWENQQYLLDEKLPLGDATIGIAIQNFFGIKIPISIF